MLIFNYGVMGSSKSAHALITEYNYKKIGFYTVLIKPQIDTRSTMVESRIGIKSKCYSFKKDDNILDLPIYPKDYDKKDLTKTNWKKVIIIVDEVQFCTTEQIEQLKTLSVFCDVFCYGLKTNFKTLLFEGSKRLIEIADITKEIPYVCECGKMAQVNALFENDKLITDGNEIRIGNKEYKPLCYECFKKYEKAHK